MSINTQQAKGIFTKTYMAGFKEQVPTPSFLRSFFDTFTTATKTVGIEVQRGTEKMAVDVIRGTNGNRNKFSLSSEKQYMPPFYNENFDATSLDRYDRVFNDTEGVSPRTIGYLAADVMEKYNTLREKINRAKEKQAAEVFETGIVQLKNGDNIDFKRKAESKLDVNTGGDYWSVTGADVEGQLISGAEFIRNKGKNGTPVLNLVMSGQAWVALKKTDYFKNNADHTNVRLVDINLPQKNAFGAAYHGQISAGAYIMNVWTYDEVYEDASGTVTRYMPSNTAFIVPTAGTRFAMAHAGVPAIIRDTANAEFGQRIVSQAAEFYLNNYIDSAGKAHIFEIYSAPLAVPVTIDMMYTMQVLA